MSKYEPPKEPATRIARRALRNISYYTDNRQWIGIERLRELAKAVLREERARKKEAARG